jgi:molecular chaperone GrpE
MLGRRKSKQGSVIPENREVEEVVEAASDENSIPLSDENMIPESDEKTEPVEKVDAGTEELNAELAVLRQELAELQDKILRKAAEFDNYRKRTHRERIELIQNANESLLKGILPLVDDFDRGMEVASKTDDMEAVRTGMDLIYSKLKEFLTNHGVKEIKVINETFDADWHEAILKYPAPTDDMKGKIVDVIQKGYTLNDKMMRYPKVVVGE